MGEVYLAQQPGIAGFAKQLVVKRIRPALAGDPQFVQMFLNEGRVAALIDHPNVVHIHELGEIDGLYFIAMEYVDGLSLAAVLHMLGDALELSTALYVVANVCEGLAYAHDAKGLDGEPLGLVHRDVSPPNILIGYSGSVKVSDFGIAKVQHHSQTAEGEVKGKFAYLSPEQARGEAVDRRSDIYALGLVLYEITVGKRANPGENDMGMAFAATRGELSDPTEVLPGYPAPLARVFARATALDPADRYQHVKEMQDELLAYQMEEGLITSAGRVGEWLRDLGGADTGAESPPMELSLDGVMDAEPPQAYAPTVAAGAKKGGPRVLEVDLEQEMAPWGNTPTRRRSRGPLFVVLGLIPALLIGVWLLLRAEGGAGGPGADAGVDAAPARPDARRAVRRRRDASRPTPEAEAALPRDGGAAVDLPRAGKVRRPARPNQPRGPTPGTPPSPQPPTPPPPDEAGDVVPGPSPLGPTTPLRLDARVPPPRPNAPTSQPTAP